MRAILAAFILLLMTTPAQACGPDTDCRIGERSYRIDPVPTARPGALIYAHGQGGSAARAMKNATLRRAAHASGLTFVALDVGDAPGWQIPHRPRSHSLSGLREIAYLDAVLDELVERHGVDPDRVVLSGFSAGGMLTWEVACNRGDRFRGFIPVAGTFWAPVPTRCPNPARKLVHVHGTADRVVPLRGRPIADAHQGDIFAALDLLQRARGHDSQGEFSAGTLSCKRQVDGRKGFLVFCTHPGGHSLRVEWITTALGLILAE